MAACGKSHLVSLVVSLEEKIDKLPGRDAQGVGAVLDQANLPKRNVFVQWDLYDFFFVEMASNQFFRIETDAQIMLDHREYLICGGGHHIRLKRKIMFHEELLVLMSRAGFMAQRNKRKVRNFSDRMFPLR